jgi:cytochrome c oxidase subunit 2
VCAEFCGIEHAKMQLLVIVQTPADFQRWVAREQLTLSPPDSETAAEGEAVFMRQPCAACHAIKGTPAQGEVGPDLSDIGARTTIGAAAIANTSRNLAAWIADAQAIKPGALMPPMSLRSRDLDSVVAYLEGLR